MSYQFVFAIVFLLAPLGSVDRAAFYSNDPIRAIMYFIFDFFGLCDVTGTPTYNPAWWYMSVAFMLIAILPLLIPLCKKYGILVPIFSFFLLRYLNPYFTLTWYAMPALAGILCAQDNIMERFTQKYDAFSWWKKILSSIGTLSLLYALWCARSRIEQCWDVLEAVIVILLCILVCTILARIPVVSGIMAFIGKYSMNMYLTHSFFYYYWFREHIYSFRYPALILFALVVETLVFSMLLEWLKKRIRYDKLIQFTCNNLDHFLLP